MNKKQILKAIKNLAKSQGFYSRMYQNIMKNIVPDEDKYETFQQFCEQQNFKDALDVVMFFEC